MIFDRVIKKYRVNYNTPESCSLVLPNNDICHILHVTIREKLVLLSVSRTGMQQCKSRREMFRDSL